MNQQEQLKPMQEPKVKHVQEPLGVIGPRRGRRTVICVLLASFTAVGLGLLFLALHPRRAPLNS